MEEMNKKEHKGMCDCYGTGTHMHHGMTRRLVLLILVVVLAFWLGMKLGEIKGYILADRGYSPMHQRGMMMYDSEDRKQMPMKVETQAAPSAPAATPVN